ncbi:unnamed protein product, partial [Ascophyllum nodosum]
GGFELLSTAIETARVEMFEVVMATISDKLTEEEVKDILVEKDILGGSLLDRAARRGSGAIREHVRSVMQRKLSENEVKELISSEGDGGLKLLSTAIGTEKGEDQSEDGAGAGTGTGRDDQSYTPTSPPLSRRKAAMKHEQPNTPGPPALEKLVLTVNEDQINPKGITKFLPGPHVQPDAGGDSSQSGENK